MGVVVPVSPPSGHIVVEHDGGVGVLRMAGEIAADTVAAYESQAPSVDGPPITAVDLSDVSFLSSSGVGVLLRRTRPARALGQIPELRGASRTARRILHLAGVADLFQERVAPERS